MSDQKRIAELDEERVCPREEREPARGYRCAVCRDDFYESEGRVYENGDFVCERHRAVYMKEYAAPDYYMDFACEHREDALSAWLFGAGADAGQAWLTREEKYAVAFQSLLAAYDDGRYRVWEFLREYCEGHEEFMTYVKHKLEQEEERDDGKRIFGEAAGAEARGCGAGDAGGVGGKGADAAGAPVSA